MKEYQLKPCPFCGRKASMLCIDHNSRYEYKVSCENIFCHVGVCTVTTETPEEAAKVWNKRVSVNAEDDS